MSYNEGKGKLFLKGIFEGYLYHKRERYLLKYHEILYYQKVPSGLREVSPCSYKIATEICRGRPLQVILVEVLGLYNFDSFELLILPGWFRFNSSNRPTLMEAEHLGLLFLRERRVG